MSRLGNELVRAPAIPSNEIDRTPSNCPTSVIDVITRGLSNFRPPSNERDIRKTLWCLTVSSHTDVDGALAVRAHGTALAPGWAPLL